MTRFPEIAPAALSQITARYPGLGPLGGIVRNGLSANTATCVFETAAGRFFAKRYDPRMTDAYALLGEHSIVLQLRAAGYPTPMLHANNRGDTLTWLAESPYAVFSLARGEDRYGDEPVFAPYRDREDARAAGAMLARYHLVLREGPLPKARPFKGLVAQYRAVASPDFPASLEALVAEVPALAAYVSSRADWHEVVRGLHEPVGRLQAMVGEWPVGIIHGDWIKRNLFWQGHEVADVLDFGLWNVGPWAYDLALAMLPVGFDWPRLLAGQAEPNHRDMVAFLAGYQATRPLEAAEREGLAPLMETARVEFYLSAVAQALLRDDQGQAALFWDLLVATRRWFCANPTWAEAIAS
ncbi:MAG: phosphotransferase [Candidatus Sericytochromatia bacterium]|nr:phosphotransferase [Candidatus Sericytochromatia bacterium]